MRIDQHANVARGLKTLASLGAVHAWTDAQLVRAFTQGGDGSADAFEALVERHGPMVLRACRATLGDGPDALDAFQATFLVLARRAGSLETSDTIAPWLYQVARRVSLGALSAAARRRRHEGLAASVRPEAANSPPPGPDQELLSRLHDEISRLPERFRAPLLLCDLQGLPHDEAARRLHCAVGTIKSRLSRARARLRARLHASDASLLAALSLPYPVPASLVASTCRSAVSPVASVAVLALAEGAWFMMRLARLRLLILPAALAASLGAVAFAFSPGPEPGQGPAPAIAAQEPPPAPVPRPLDVRTDIEAPTTVLSIRPDGTLVKKGDLVCELDTADARDSLAALQIETERRNADYESAKAASSLAELELEEYEQGLYPHQLHAADGEIQLASAALGLQRARLDALKAAPETDLDRMAASLEVRRAEIALDAAKREQVMLEHYTRPIRTTTLKAALERSKAAELHAKVALATAQEKEQFQRRLIEFHKVYAPADGIVRHAHIPGREAFVTEGTGVHPRQVIFQIDPDPASLPSAERAR